MRKSLSLLAALGLASASLVATTSAAPAAAPKCVINNFSPRSVAIGLSEVSPTFSVKASSGCDPTPWTLTGEDFAANDKEPDYTFGVPMKNKQATSENVVVQVYVAGGGSTKERTFDNGFSIKRKTYWANTSLTDHVNGHFVSGKVSGDLKLVNWTKQRYDSYSHRSVALEFLAADDDSEQWVKVSSGTTDSSGHVALSYRTDISSYYRLHYFGTSTVGASTTQKFHVDDPG